GRGGGLLWGGPCRGGGRSRPLSPVTRIGRSDTSSDRHDAAARRRIGAERLRGERRAGGFERGALLGRRDAHRRFFERDELLEALVAECAIDEPRSTRPALGIDAVARERGVA